MSEKKHKSKIGHSLEELEDGLILTIQDKPVLLNGEVNEEDDVFENYEKRIQNEAEHNKELREKLNVIANAATSHLEGKNEGVKDLLPHYNDHSYKSDNIDLDEEGTIAKRSRPKISKALQNDFEAPQTINSEYYERETKFKQRKNKQKENTSDLLSFLNETAVEKEYNQEDDKIDAVDILESTLNTVRKRRNIENKNNFHESTLVNEDDELLAKAVKLSSKKAEQANILEMIKEENEDEGAEKQKCIEIEMNPVNYRGIGKETEKVYNINDAAKGVTSCLNVNLPSEKIVIKKEEEMPNSFKDITPEEFEKMKEEVSFLEQQNVGIGLSDTIEFLRKNKLLAQEEQFGRTNDKTSDHNQIGDRVKLEYRNSSGQLMKPKEAFRYLSAIFHGQGPGKNKIEKIKKKELLEMRMKEVGNQPGKLMNLLEKHQSKTGDAHMVIQLGAKNKEAE